MDKYVLRLALPENGSLEIPVFQITGFQYAEESLLIKMSDGSDYKLQMTEELVQKVKDKYYEKLNNFTSLELSALINQSVEDRTKVIQDQLAKLVNDRMDKVEEYMTSTITQTVDKISEDASEVNRQVSDTAKESLGKIKAMYDEIFEAVGKCT